MEAASTTNPTSPRREVIPAPTLDGVAARPVSRADLAASAAPVLGVGPGQSVSMRDFVTDGSVAALCEELGRTMGVPIWLRDKSGEVIVADWSSSIDGMDQRHAWSVVSEAEGRATAFERAGASDDGGSEVFSVALRIRAGLLGAIAVALPRDGGLGDGAESARSGAIKRALSLLATTVCEICEAQWALAKRVRELDALYRLSSLLSFTGGPEEVMSSALDLAMQVLDAEAGSIGLVEPGPDEGDLKITTRVRKGLSEQWTAQTSPLSHGGKLRRAALRGEIVAIENLATDERIAAKDRVKAEGIVSLLTTGLLDQGRPIGLIRLYTKRPRVFTPAEGELLRAIADHTASAVTTTNLRRLRAQDEALARQVRLAASVQRRMLPRSIPKVEPFEIAAHYAPTLELGGDFYDFLELGGHLGVLIGDVCGKGVPAALLMASVRAAIRAYADQLYHIDEVLEKTNAALVRDTLDNEFATVWLGVADPRTLRLTYCGAGHDWPLLIRAPKGRAVEESDVSRLTADGMALGIDAMQRYPKGMVQLHRGDILVTYTDGLHDAINAEGKRFGGTRLRRAIVELLRAEPGASAGRIIDHVLAAVRQHAGIAGRNDDITLVVMRVL